MIIDRLKRLRSGTWWDIWPWEAEFHFQMVGVAQHSSQRWVMNIRPAVSTCKEPSQLVLLTVDIPLWILSWYSASPSRHWYAILLWLHMAWGLREGVESIGWGRWSRDKVPSSSHGEAIVCTEWMLLSLVPLKSHSWSYVWPFSQAQ